MTGILRLVPSWQAIVIKGMMKPSPKNTIAGPPSATPISAGQRMATTMAPNAMARPATTQAPWTTARALRVSPTRRLVIGSRRDDQQQEDHADRRSESGRRARST